MPTIDMFWGNASIVSVALTDVPTVGRVFQRSAGLTTGPVHIAGTYVSHGYVPLNLEGQVRLVADNTIVVAWTALTDFTQGAGTWSGTIPGVDQSLEFIYKCEVRCADDHGLTSAGSNAFGVGAIPFLYGQSNMGVMTFTNDGAAPAAASGTVFFGESGPNQTDYAWRAVPIGNGIRQILNGLKTSLGVCCAATNISVTAASASFLASEAHWADTVDPFLALMGDDFEMILWNQGEAEAAGLGSTENSYFTNMLQLQSVATGRTGRSIANLPIIYSSIGTQTTGGSFNAAWSAIQTTLFDIDVLTGLFLSHTEIDFSRPGDGTHKDGTDCDKSGKRYAAGVKKAYGLAANFPSWFIASAAVVDATHTDVTVTHVNGTDFTPTSGITGMEVSGNSGVEPWTSATGARTSATVIRLTHASLPTGPRLLRNLWGEIPDISACVHDNSTLALPLNYTPYWITCSTASPTPVPTYQLQIAGINVAGAVKTFSDQRLHGITANSFIMVSLAQSDVQPTSVVVTPIDSGGSNGTPISLSKTVGVSGSGSIWQNDGAHPLPSGTVNSTVVVTWAAPPNTSAFIDVWTTPLAGLSSTTATGTGTASSGSTTVATSAGGFVVVGCSSSAPRGTIGGTEAYCQDHILSNGTTEGTASAHAAPVSANASSSVTITGPATYKVWAAAWR